MSHYETRPVLGGFSGDDFVSTVPLPFPFVVNLKKNYLKSLLCVLPLIFTQHFTKFINLQLENKNRNTVT